MRKPWPCREVTYPASSPSFSLQPLRTLPRDLSLPLHPQLWPSRDRALLHRSAIRASQNHLQRAGQGRENFHFTAGNGDSGSNDLSKVILAWSWQSCYSKPWLWTPRTSAHLIPPISLPSFPPPTAALVPLYQHLHSFCISSSSLSVFLTEFLQTLLEERRRKPLEEKGRGRCRAGSWRVEVRQLHCNSRMHHVHCRLCQGGTCGVEQCTAWAAGCSNPAGGRELCWLCSQDEVNVGGAEKPRIEQNR